VKKLAKRACALAAAAVVVAGPSLATAQAAMATTPPPSPCTWGYDDGAEKTVPTARKPGVMLRQWVPVRNHQSVAIPNAYVTMVTSGDVQRRAPHPTVWWRRANGHWQQARLTWVWNSAISQGESQWVSSNLEVGTLAPHATKWVEVDLTFPARSIKGVYFQYFLEQSHSCGGAVLAMYLGGVEYWPWRGREGQPV
jgi:hypothetical protein